MRRLSGIWVGTVLLATLISSACRREARRFSEAPAASRLNPNAATAPQYDHQMLVLYSEDAWAMSQGQELFGQMNCAGCHSHGGGGGMGPPLMDSKWIYGNSLDEIERSIVGGRPNGMPAFGTRLSPQQIWQLVAYVRSLSGDAPRQAESARDDHMAVRPPPSRTDPEPPARQKVD